MEAGKLNQRIEFYHLELQTDDYGHEIYNYEFAFATRANVIYNSGNRIIENSEIFYDNTLSFSVRSYCPVQDTDRIKYRNNFYRILSVNDEYNKHNKKIIIAELINE